MPPSLSNILTSHALFSESAFKCCFIEDAQNCAVISVKPRTSTKHVRLIFSLAFKKCNYTQNIQACDYFIGLAFRNYLVDVMFCITAEAH